jgi:Flp pilus assembly protein TadG
MIRRLRDERGQALVEFAVVLPILLVLLLGIIQTGIYLFTISDVNQAARTGGRMLTTLRNDANAETEVEAKVAGSVSQEIDPTRLSYSFSPALPSGGWTPGTVVTMTVTYPASLSVMGINVNSGPNVDTETVTVS